MGCQEVPLSMFLRVPFAFMVLSMWVSCTHCFCSGGERSLDESLKSCQIRLVWGGGKARPYSGSLQVIDGEISRCRSLGVRSQSAAESLLVDSHHVALSGDARSTFGGCDLTLQATRATRIIIQWQKTDGTMEELNSSIEEILEVPKQIALDEEGNRCVLERLPGDAIQVRVPKSSMVFRIGESIEWSFQPTWVPFGEGPSTLHCLLLEESSNHVVFEESYPIQLDAQGSMQQPLVIPHVAPSTAGVYRWKLSIEPRKKFGQFWQNAKPYSRSVQWVVVGTEEHTNNRSPWRILERLDLFEAESGDGEGQSILKRWRGNHSKLHSSASAPLERFETEQGSLLVLRPDQWRALPVTTSRIGMPHQIQIRIPTGQGMICSVSLLEPNQLGWFESVSIAGGFALEEGPTDDTFATYRFLFWPTTDHSMLLLCNRGNNNVAIESISILDGPESLLTDEELQDARSPPNRLSLFEIDYPLFTRAFGGPLEFEPRSRRSLEDWTSWYVATMHLAQYCRASGYRGILLKSCDQGATIYPSEVLGGNARFDQGMFFPDGRDPIPKDVLELILSIFDHCGLQVVTSLNISGVIPRLEQIRIARKEAPDTWPYLRNAKGEVWSSTLDAVAGRSMGVRYDPSNPEFEAWFSSYLQELRNRYSHHPSWAGVALDLQPDSHLIYPGLEWGFSGESLQRFAGSLQSRIPMVGPALQEAIQGPLREPWLQWRATELGNHFKNLVSEIDKTHPLQKNWILTAGITGEPPSSALSSVRAIENEATVSELLERGIATPSFHDLEQWGLVRGEIERPLGNLVDQRCAIRDAMDTELDRLLSLSGTAAAQLTQSVDGWWLGDVPFLGDSESARPSPLWLSPHITDLTRTALRRVVRRLESSDLLNISMGGATPVATVDPDKSRLLKVLAKLPPRSMQSILSEGGQSGTHVQVRTVEYLGVRYVTFLNNSGWFEQIDLQWQEENPQSIEWLLQADDDRERSMHEQHLPKELLMAPYSFAVVRFDEVPHFRLRWHHEASREVIEHLQADLTTLSEIVNRVASRSVTVQLLNGGFDSPQDGNDTIVGWQTSLLPSTRVEVDSTRKHGGQSSLHLENHSQSGTAWIQSVPMRAPETGRLALEFYAHAPTGSSPVIQVSLLRKRANGSKVTTKQIVPIDMGDEPRAVDPAGIATTRPRWAYCMIPLVRDERWGDFSEIQISIDLVSQCEVWLDDMIIYDVFLLDEERRSLRTEIFVASRELERGNLTKASRLLESHWARTLNDESWASKDVFDREPVPPGKVTSRESQLNSRMTNSKLNEPSNPEKNETAMVPDFHSVQKNQQARSTSGRRSSRMPPESERLWFKRLRESLRR